MEFLSMDSLCLQFGMAKLQDNDFNTFVCIA